MKEANNVDTDDDLKMHQQDIQAKDNIVTVTTWREEFQEEAGADVEEGKEEDDDTLMYPGTLVSADLYYDHDVATRTGLDVGASNTDEKADIEKTNSNKVDKQHREEQQNSIPPSTSSPADDTDAAATATAKVESEQKDNDKDDMETLEDYENIVLKDDPDDLEGRFDADGASPQEKQQPQPVVQQQMQKGQQQPPLPAALFIPPQELECVRIMEKRMKEIRQNSHAYKAHDISYARRHETDRKFETDVDVDIDANDLYVLASAAAVNNEYREDGDEDYQGEVDDQNTISELSFDQHLVSGPGDGGYDVNGRPFDEQSLPSLPSLAYMMHQQSGGHSNNVDMVPRQYLTSGQQHPHDEVEPHLQFNWNVDEEKADGGGNSTNDYCKGYSDDKQKQLRRKRLIYFLAIGLCMVICAMVVIILLNTVFAADRTSSGQSTDSNANSVNDGASGGFSGQDTIGNNGDSGATTQPTTIVSVIDGSTQPSSMPSLEDPTTPTNSPTVEQTSPPPTLAPTILVPPTIAPSFNPSSLPSIGPSNQPSEAVVVVVTSAPSAAPTTKPTSRPTPAPTTKPTSRPTPAPTGCMTLIETSRDCYSSNNPTVRISFQNCDPQSQDWVGIFSVDDYSGRGGVPEPAIWDFTCGTKSCNQITPEGDLTFNSNSNFFRPGRSYVAVLAREGTGPPYTRISSSGTFEIATNC